MPDQTRRAAARTATVVAIPVALLVGVLVFWLMGGWGRDGSPRPQATTPVSVPAPPLGDRAATVCRALVAELPGAVRDLPRRPVTAGAEQNAAYGDPPLTLACGVPPASFPADAQLWGISGVCWYADRRPDGAVWTTVDREVPVTVTVPTRYEGPGDWVAEFSAPLTATVRAAAQPPAACR